MVGIQLDATVGEKGQVVIPKPIRELFNIMPNSELLFDVEDEKIVLTKKRSGLDAFEEFITAVKHKKKFAEKIDWDSEYYSQFNKR